MWPLSRHIRKACCWQITYSIYLFSTLMFLLSSVMILLFTVMIHLNRQNTDAMHRCGYMSSQAVCKACLLLEGLNRGLPNYGLRDKARVRHDRAAALSQPPQT